jgi:hypothetical protein
MVIDDNRRHSGGRQVRVVEAGYELAVFSCRERVCDELMARSRRQEDDSVAKIDNGDSTTLVESPAVPDRRGDRHLPTSGHQELGWDAHDHTPVIWYQSSLPSVPKRRRGGAVAVVTDPARLERAASLSDCGLVRTGVDEARAGSPPVWSYEEVTSA